MKRLFCASLLVVAWTLVSWSPEATACYVTCPMSDNHLTADAPGTRTPDLNFSGAVTLPDFAIFGAAFVGAFDACSDFNCDGIINLADFAIFARHWLHAGGSFAICAPV